ncbi:LapA family protein [Paramaledivibacter caminithermalis]|jgi:uncharacterized integral membrane protein|uniref:Uncharacterized integral membrane protein n=1 Tax=Paramaledivibacter caminithermalis (strain DSM 15212 / CIP 107654 / DViRD3) TaxID=1121301 RepID=A0A1M6JWP5_PARC5|nr:LapA family protein [Paramaledivibacter caminithermalis]SHJ51096.1 Uncharacterized integral membrane protein [Paramaledivibacter caminithermalis DSM 15212]
MQILFVFSLVFAILVSLFAVMNSDPVTIKLLWKQYRFSQAIVILGSAAIGAIIVALLGIFSKVKSSLKIRELNNKIRKLEREIQEPKSFENSYEDIRQGSNVNNNLDNIDNDTIKEQMNINFKNNEINK